jgi:hypothetical protein
MRRWILCIFMKPGIKTTELTSTESKQKLTVNSVVSI